MSKGKEFCIRWTRSSALIVNFKQVRYIPLPAQIFLSHPVVLELICFRTRAKRLINESNATEGLQKIWMGSTRQTCFLAFPAQIFFCDPVVLESTCYRTTTNRLVNKSNATGGLIKLCNEIPSLRSQVAFRHFFCLF